MRSFSAERKCIGERPDLEVGLLLHFGLEAKFYRVVELRSRKERKSNLDTDLTDYTDLTDRSLVREAPPSRKEEMNENGDSSLES